MNWQFINVIQVHAKLHKISSYLDANFSEMIKIFEKNSPQKDNGKRALINV